MDFIAGKVVLITGGAGSIGLAIVKNLLNHGAKGVAIVDISEEAGRKAVTEVVNIFDQKRITFIKTDITNKTELEGAFETTIKKYKHLDIVINNAGILDEIEWKNTIAVNLVAVIEGTYLAMQKYLPKYKSGEEGLIINTASICGLHSFQINPVYCATKHGLIGLGKALGGDEFYKKYKVRVLTICPGLMNTPISGRADGFLFPEVLEKEVSAVCLVAQAPERVSEGLIEAIQKGKNGSLWVIENNEPVYEVVVPQHKTMKV
ncbi:15-hydroxyprostaglandin dehydrogenase [NAD(+)]-like [Zophobas morio]|uniref:15-hydroxyprostaglandin dehydrogenase [NAD(+)]-like n=1 Tax=Zophobas morio TaxID=2755281 RepID=UPI003082B22C